MLVSMEYLLNIAIHFRRRMLGKSPAIAPTICSVFLMGVLLVGLGNVVACQYFSPTCKFCGSSLSAGKVHTPEGHDVCKECNRDAVRDVRTAQALVAQVRSELASFGIHLPWGAIPIKMGPSANPAVYARCEAMRYANGSVGALWIRFVPGLPKSMFKLTAAHELTHAWAYLNRCPANQDEALSEGAPTLVEYLYLERYRSTYGERRRNEIMTSSNRIYGKGTRRLQAYAKDHGGLPGVLTLLRTGQTIPKGY